MPQNKNINGPKTKKISSNEDRYFAILHLIEKGFYEDASLELRDLRKQLDAPTLKLPDHELQSLALLLGARIALKGGTKPEHLEAIQENSFNNPFLSGELCFVKGSYYFGQGHWQLGSECFEKASNYFKISLHDQRQWMAKYNQIICLTYDTSKNSHWHFTELRQLELLIKNSSQKTNKVLGLVCRQKSYLYKEQGRYDAAKLEARLAIEILEIDGAHSDFQLALLNLIDIHLELNQVIEARIYFEMVMGPTDPRVQFPVALFQHRIYGTRLNMDHIEKSCPHFIERYENFTARNLIVENKAPKTQEIFNEKTQSYPQIRSGSMEEGLINNLKNGPISKELLCERLWPSYSQIHLLDNRLHRLISRVNKKFGDRIQFEKGLYVFCEK